MIFGVNYYVLNSLIARSQSPWFPRNIREIIRTGEILNAKDLTESFKNEILNFVITDAASREFFFFLSEQAVTYTFLRGDVLNYLETWSLIQKRIDAETDLADEKDWVDYLKFIHIAFERSNRKVSTEFFEDLIENLDWSDLNEKFLPKYSGWVGIIYLHEEKPEVRNKAKFWLEKGCAGLSLQESLLFYIEKAGFLFKDNKPDAAQKIEKYISVLDDQSRDGSVDPRINQLFRYAVLEMHSRAMLNRIGNFDDNQVRLEETLGSLRDVERNFDLEGRNAPHFIAAGMKLEFARIYLSLGKSASSREDAEDLFSMASDCLELASKAVQAFGDDYYFNNIRLRWMEVMSYRPAKVSEKEMRETALIFKKAEMNRQWAQAYAHLARYFQSLGASQKAFDAVTDLLKSGLKNPTEGGLYLFTKGFAITNDILLAETEKPGVSWMVGELLAHFNRISEAADLMEASGESIGNSLFTEFRNEFARFEKVSNFHILVYFKYQWYSIRLMRAGAALLGDEAGRQIADNLIRSMSDQNNPLSMIRADWPDFKDVPNDVRNKVINKCISISKGDLPAAADHLVFSYRNLRSYITFKEVNRLGFFLDEVHTTQKQLEQGIRLMFHDLYKDGTIFEVVFDMPKFLVQHAADGFTSPDLEEALNIKSTTAKKYIKIMMDSGIIHYDKSQGRKHFFRLRRTNIMNRFGQEQKVVVES